jgi:PAS domain S-box-containing protein
VEDFFMTGGKPRKKPANRVREPETGLQPGDGDAGPGPNDHPASVCDAGAPPVHESPIEHLKTTILDSIADIVAFYPSPDMTPAWMNQALISASGYDRADLLSMTCHECWFQRQTPCPDCPVLKTFETETPHEMHQETPDGRCWYVRSFPMLGEAGGLQGVVEVARDITDQKRAEKALSENLEKYRMLFHSSPVGICSYDMDGRIIESNQTCADIMGTTVDRLLAFNLLEDTVDREFRAAIADSLRGRTTHYEGFYTSVTGGRRSFLKVDFAPIYSFDNRIIGGVAVGADVIDKVHAELALQESEAKYRGILANIEDGYYEVDLHGNLTFFNDSLCEILGYPRSELMGMNYRTFMLEEDADRVFKTFNQVFATGSGAKGSEWRVKRKDGAVVYLDTSVSLIRDAEGNVQNFGGITRDVTERRYAEDALRASEEKYRSLFESLPIGLFQTTIDGRIIDANPACLQIFRCPSREELMAQDARKAYLKPADGENFRRQLMRNGSVRDYESRLWCWDGSIVWVNITAHVIYDDWGNFSHIEGSLQDITLRKQNEMRLQESEAKYRGLTERSSDVIAVVDKNGKPIFWSPSSEQILGYTYDELMAREPSELMGADDYERMLVYIDQIVEQKAADSFEISMTRKDGAEIIIEWTATPIYYGKKLSGLQFVGRDITTRKKAEAALQKSHEQLRNLSKHLEAAREQERTAIAREVHDDLGQLLTAIKFDLAWMKRHAQDVDADTLLEKVDMSMGLVDGSLQSVKQISARLRPEILSDLGLEAAMDWYLSEFRERTGIKCDSRIQQQAFSGDRICDELCISMFRIFQEALTNIARHSRATEVFVKLNQSDGWIDFQIIDNGVGIDTEVINDTQSFGLLGIRERVNAFGGNMELTGDPEKGTALKIKLPAVGKAEESPVQH